MLIACPKSNNQATFRLIWPDNISHLVYNQRLKQPTKDFLNCCISSTHAVLYSGGQKWAHLFFLFTIEIDCWMNNKMC